jgi:hypothetical protein
LFRPECCCTWVFSRSAWVSGCWFDFMDMKRSFVLYTFDLLYYSVSNGYFLLPIIVFSLLFCNRWQPKSTRYNHPHLTNKRLLKSLVIGKTDRLHLDIESFRHHNSKHLYKSSYKRDLGEPSSLWHSHHLWIGKNNCNHISKSSQVK